MYVRVHAMPGAKKERILQKGEAEFEVSVREPAERNLANHRVREMIADVYGVNPRTVRLISGHRSPTKIFDVEV